MKRTTIKLFLTITALLVAAIMVVASSYAWLVLSKSPTANGISVAIGGGTTILLAPDTVGVDSSGNAIHYPGKFDSSLDFSEFETYDYLSQAEGLSPVSTSDGINWILPTYTANKLNDISDFEVDDTLSSAAVNGSGRYIYLDFWVVSPGSEYELRVSTDSELGVGSYLIEKPMPVRDGESYRLAMPGNVASSDARIGFLANSDISSDSAMTAYLSSENYNSSYAKLKGVYNEPGEKQTATGEFSVYEPNATSHPFGEISDGDYSVTYPLAYDSEDNTIYENTLPSFSSHLAVQLANSWHIASNAQTTSDSMNSLMIGQAFKAAIAGRKFANNDEAADYFYNTYLQNNIDSYLYSAKFISDSTVLYANAEAAGGVVDALTIAEMRQAGASDGAVITTLERNTPQRIRMFVWLEGQDVDCTAENGVRASEIAMRLELAGS